MTSTSKPSVYDLSCFAPSPRNPAMRIAGLDLDEMVLSIRQSGIINPIIARPRPGLEIDERGPQFEIVCGHRRWAAAKKAGLIEIPAILMDLDDTQADVVRITENLQRRDLSPLEEASSFVQLAKLGLDGRGIADKIGKSETYVRQRMLLVGLPAAARKALAEGALALTPALMLARIRDEATRTKAWNDLRRYNTRDLDADTVREFLNSNVTHALKNAPFDVRDASLVPEAGACNDCPKRSGNDPALFPDMAAEVCTDGPCFLRKSAESTRRQLEAHAREGGTVLSGKETEAAMGGLHSKHGKYIELDERNWRDIKGRTWKQLFGKTPIKVVMAKDPRDGSILRLTERKAAEEAARKAGVKSETPSSPSERARASAERIKSMARAEGLREAIGEIVRRCEAGASDPDHTWSILLEAALHGSWHDTIVDVLKRRGWHEKGKQVGGVLEAQARKLGPKERRGLVVELAVTRGADGWSGLGKPLKLAAQVFGVNVQKYLGAALREKQKKARESKKAKAKKGGR